MSDKTIDHTLQPSPKIQRWLGSIEVSTQAIITVAGRSAITIDGVVGIATRKLRYGAAELLPPERYNQGIQVQYEGDQITVTIYIVAEHGLSIPALAYKAVDAVYHALESMLGTASVYVYIVVQGLWLTSDEQ